jgi:hypothetical protein
LVRALSRRSGVLDHLVDLILVLLVLHVDEVDHHQAAHVAQAQLAGHLVGRLQVDLHDGLLLAVAALVAAGVDVDGDQGLRLVEDQVAAALQPDLAAEGVLQLPLDVEVLEDGRVALIDLHPAAHRAREAGDDGLDAVALGLGVDDDAVDVIGQGVAHHALDQVGLLVEAAGRGLLLDAGLDLASRSRSARARRARRRPCGRRRRRCG